MTTVSVLNISSYDSVFNFFDCRDYAERAFNDDFLEACRQRFKKTREIVIGVPIQYFDQDTNELIRVRMLDEFKKELVDFRREAVKKKIYAFFALFLGLAVVGAYGYLSFAFTEFGVWFRVFLDIVYVTGYFGIWGGCDTLLFGKTDSIILWPTKSRLAKAKISFQCV